MMFGTTFQVCQTCARLAVVVVVVGVIFVVAGVVVYMLVVDCGSNLLTD